MGRLIPTFAAAVSAIAVGASRSVANHPDVESAHDNAFAIFNSIHSAMRQWGSSVHHNGLSFYLSTAPEGSTFYHGGLVHTVLIASSGWLLRWNMPPSSLPRGSSQEIWTSTPEPTQRTRKRFCRLFLDIAILTQGHCLTLPMALFCMIRCSHNNDL